MPVRRAFKGLTVSAIRGRFRAQQKRRPQLRPVCAEVHHAVHSRAVHDAACGDKRNINAPFKRLNQGKGTHLPVGRLGIKDATMAAGLVALRHHHIDSQLYGQLRLCHAGGARQGNDAFFTQPVNDRSLRNTKMEADHRRSQIEQKLGHPGLLLKTQVDFRQRLRRKAAKARKLRAQSRQPLRFTLRVPYRRSVAKNVDVKRTGG